MSLVGDRTTVLNTVRDPSLPKNQSPGTLFLMEQALEYSTWLLTAGSLLPLRCLLLSVHLLPQKHRDPVPLLLPEHTQHASQPLPSACPEPPPVTANAAQLSHCDPRWLTLWNCL